MKRLLLVLLPCLVAATLARASAIVDTDHVASAVKRGAIIWDVRATSEYRKGHIPGAVSIGHAGAVLRNANTEDFIAVEQIEKLLGSAGIDPREEVIVYATRGDPYAYFGLYALQYFGAKWAYVYHDGIDGWRKAGQPVAAGEEKRAPVALQLQPDPSVAVSTSEVLAALKKPGMQILDVRTPKEYSGEDIRALRGGRIPGALNIPYEQNWVDPETPWKLARRQVADNAGMSLKPVEQLKSLYAGLDRQKETIVYCQSGVRAAETATVLAQLGFRNVKVYDSSWLGYGNTLDAPAENVQFLNVGLLNARLAAMQARLEALERELAEARAGSK